MHKNSALPACAAQNSLKTSLKIWLLAALWSLVALSSRADLSGDTLQVNYGYPATSSVYTNFSTTNLTTTGASFEIFGFINFTLFPTRLVITNIGSLSHPFTSYGNNGFNGFSLTDVTSSNRITGATIDPSSNLSGFSAARISFSKSTLLLNFSGLIFQQNTHLQINLNTTPAVTSRVSCTCDGHGIAGASVQIGTYSATTDTNGFYALSNLPAGTYPATITANGYDTLATNVEVSAGETMVTNNFALTNQTLNINPVFDATITSNPNARAITNAIKSALQIYQQNLANPICVTLLFATTTNASVLGENSAARASLPYFQYIADLQANPDKSATDATALASLPPGPGTGINGNTQVILTAANLAAIGETSLAASAVAGNGGGYHGKVYLNVASLSGVQAAAEHEIDETLGIGGWGSSLYLAGSYTGQPSPTTGIGALDLYRFSAPGARSFNLKPSTTAYFSIDGGNTALVYFNQYGNGSDFGDWGDGVSPADGQGNNPAQVQDAFGSGNATLGANELLALDAIGYTVTSATPRIQSATIAANKFTAHWSAVPGQSYQVQFSASPVGSTWNNLGGPVIASNLLAGISDTTASAPSRFYRVVNVTAPTIKSLVLHPAPTPASATAINLPTNTPATRRFYRVIP